MFTYCPPRLRVNEASIKRYAASPPRFRKGADRTDDFLWSSFASEYSCLVHARIDAPPEEQVLDQHFCPRVGTLFIAQSSLSNELTEKTPSPSALWRSVWKRSNHEFALWTKHSCVVEVCPFSSWTDEPTTAAIVPLRGGSSTTIAAKSWFRICCNAGHDILAFQFFASPSAVQIDFGVDLPYFVYGTLRSGYANHNKFMKGKKRIGNIWQTANPMSLYVGKWPYLFETPLPGTTGTFVKGELYEIKAKDCAELDELEEEYRKDLIVVTDENLCAMIAVTYFGETVTFDSFQNVKLISSGDLATAFPSHSHWN
jgi:gamma-glutamylcyclotransferase (GGCT)/AIG2-like uncharacterized protein YtfP